MFLDNNPPPILDTVSSACLKHFMEVISEQRDESLPVLQVAKYFELHGFSDIAFMVNITMSIHGTFSQLKSDYYEKIRKAENGK